ncbi:hypothetical protein PoB_000956700 [Plakobranchus ocellatus]|uniref:Uncharacterized protein n=1 Tax=Plakobranchus ocellatus TaxID=259542 RepID=A0AAV3YLN8_9GAST|nr:hypothetical protein PoB_000956700 [Plakobranchus ocellatus]
MISSFYTVKNGRIQSSIRGVYKHIYDDKARRRTNIKRLISYFTGDDGGTVNSKSALRSEDYGDDSGKMDNKTVLRSEGSVLPWVQAPPSAPWPDRGSESLR